MIFSDVMSCSLADGCTCPRRTCWYHHKVEAVDYSKRLMLLYQTTWCHKPEDSNFNVLLSVEVCAVI